MTAEVSSSGAAAVVVVAASASAMVVAAAHRLVPGYRYSVSPASKTHCQQVPLRSRWPQAMRAALLIWCGAQRKLSYEALITGGSHRAPQRHPSCQRCGLAMDRYAMAMQVANESVPFAGVRISLQVFVAEPGCDVEFNTSLFCRYAILSILFINCGFHIRYRYP